MRGTLMLALLAIFGIASVPCAADTADNENVRIDANVLSALQKMGAYLRSLKAFRVQAVTTDEDILDDGQRVQYLGTADILSVAPNRVRIEYSNDVTQRLLFYNGTTFTLFAPLTAYYASIPAPPTTAQLVKVLDSQYDVSVPLEDLFHWGSSGWSSNAIEGAMDVGPSSVEGTTCEQYALRQRDIDWQIWVQLGDYPLPRRIVITTRTDPAHPQHTAVYTWNLAPSFNDAAFTFDAPRGAIRVALSKSALAAAGRAK